MKQIQKYHKLLGIISLLFISQWGNAFSQAATGYGDSTKIEYKFSIEKRQNLWFVIKRIDSINKQNNFILLEDKHWNQVRIKSGKTGKILKRKRFYYDPKKNGYLFFELK